MTASEIKLTASSLQSAARTLRDKARTLYNQAGALSQQYNGLDWQVRAASTDIERSVNAAANGANQLARYAESLASMLDAVVQGFQQLDAEASRNLDKIVDLSLAGKWQLETYDPLANVPLQTIIGVLTAGDLRQVGRTLLDAIPLPQLRILKPLAGGEVGKTFLSWGQNGWQQGDQDPHSWNVFSGQVPPVPLVGFAAAGIGGFQGLLDTTDHTVLDSLRSAVQGIPVIGDWFGKQGTYAYAGQGVIGGAVNGALRGTIPLGTAFHASTQVWQGSLGNDNAHLGAQMLSASAYSRQGLSADLGHGSIGANWSGGVALNAAALQAGLQGSLGDDMFGGGAGATGEAFAGAQADARAGLQADLMRGQISENVGVDAFAGAKATAQGQIAGSLGGATLAAGGHASAWAGIGVKADVSGSLDLASGKIGFKADFGAALGVGADVGIDVNIDVGGAVQKAKDFVANLIPPISLPKISLPPKPSWWPF